MYIFGKKRSITFYVLANNSKPLYFSFTAWGRIYNRDGKQWSRLDVLSHIRVYYLQYPIVTTASHEPLWALGAILGIEVLISFALITVIWVQQLCIRTIHLKLLSVDVSPNTLKKLTLKAMHHEHILQT